MLLSAESLSDMSERKELCQYNCLAYISITELIGDNDRHRIYGMA